MIIYKSTNRSSLLNSRSIFRKLTDFLTKEAAHQDSLLLRVKYEDEEKKNDWWRDTALKSGKDALDSQTFIQCLVSEQSIPSRSDETACTVHTARRDTPEVVLYQHDFEQRACTWHHEEVVRDRGVVRQESRHFRDTYGRSEVSARLSVADVQALSSQHLKAA